MCLHFLPHFCVPNSLTLEISRREHSVTCRPSKWHCHKSRMGENTHLCVQERNGDAAVKVIAWDAAETITEPQGESRSLERPRSRQGAVTWLTPWIPAPAFRSWASGPEPRHICGSHFFLSSKSVLDPETSIFLTEKSFSGPWVIDKASWMLPDWETKKSEDNGGPCPRNCSQCWGWPTGPSLP